jgi:hypothetical protein
VTSYPQEVDVLQVAREAIGDGAGVGVDVDGALLDFQVAWQLG